MFQAVAAASLRRRKCLASEAVVRLFDAALAVTVGLEKGHVYTYLNRSR